MKNTDGEQDKRHKKSYKSSVFAAILLVVLASAGFVSLYPRFHEHASDYVSEYNKDVMAGETFLQDLYQGNSVLYKQLLEQVKGETLAYQDIYITVTQEPSHDASIFVDFGKESGAEYAGRMMDEMLTEWEYVLWNRLDYVMDYQITDHTSGQIISNTGNDIGLLGSQDASEALLSYYPYYIKLSYDNSGFLEHVWVKGNDSDTLLKNVQRVMKSSFLERCFYEYFPSGGYNADQIRNGGIDYYHNGEIIHARIDVNSTPRSCTICYALTTQQKENMIDSNLYQQEIGYLDGYYSIGVQDVFRVFLLILGALALILPLSKRYHLHEAWILQLHPEVLLVILLVLFYQMGEIAVMMVMFTMKGGHDYSASGMMAMIRSYLPRLSMEQTEAAAVGINILLFTFMFGLWYILVSGLGQVHTLGFKRYIREKSICYRIFQAFRTFAVRNVTQFKDEILHVDLGQNTNRILLKIVAVNYLILAFLSMLWFAGVFMLLFYSVILYIALKKYIRHIQVQYRHLLAATKSIADGNLQTEFTDDWGIFESYKSKLQEIQEGFSLAVEEEVKSQRMRTELITNVSHDLKTPLTAITTYIELLQEEDITQEQRKEYLDVLKRKALRLKTLIEDLFEVSKANSGNVSFHLDRVDIGNLMRQVYLEYEDKVKQADLIFRFWIPEEKQYIMLDSEKTYRIFDNLYTNIIKYAMPHTRVYANVERRNEDVVIELKNISKAELTIAPDSLTERFVRGDSSRNTEGSGLGLAIARSFVELQKGRMQVEIDGDLFKVTIVWKGL